jgi:hypothetical protein
MNISGYQTTSYVKVRELPGFSDFYEIQNCMWRILTVTNFLEDKRKNILKRVAVNFDEGVACDSETQVIYTLQSDPQLLGRHAVV